MTPARCIGIKMVDDANLAVESPLSPQIHYRRHIRVLGLYSDYKSNLVSIEMNDLT